jgi:hypothetical protein
MVYDAERVQDENGEEQVKKRGYPERADPFQYVGEPGMQSVFDNATGDKR